MVHHCPACPGKGQELTDHPCMKEQSLGRWERNLVYTKSQPPWVEQKERVRGGAVFPSGISLALRDAAKWDGGSRIPDMPSPGSSPRPHQQETARTTVPGQAAPPQPRQDSG
jgi:hypothetical protein